MKPQRFFWSAHPLRALAEAWLLGAAIVYMLAQLIGHVVPFVLDTSGLLFLCGSSGMWAVLRVRIPSGSRWRQLCWELGVATALAGVMATLLYPAATFGLDRIWVKSGWGRVGTTLLLLATGAGYLIARAGVRIWLIWDQMRRQRLRWSITNAHLMIVVAVGILGAVGVFVLSPYSGTALLMQGEASGPVASVATQVIAMLFPTLSLMAIGIVLGVVLLLPPSAVFSYLVARQTTHRLEALAATAAAMRSGHYDARALVTGEDEVAQLQATFNAMADDLERTVGDLQAQRDRVEHLLDTRRELIANVSHELRTPVATVRATLESAVHRSGDQLTPELVHDLRVINDEMLRLQGLIDDLFTLSRIEVEALPLNCGPIDVAAITQRMVDAVAPLAWQAGKVDVIADLPAGLPLVCADESRLGQVLANLLRNAIRHTPPGGIVAVMARAEDASVVIEVKDTGEGISAEDLPHIWERFYRGAEGRARDGMGAGLGLALVKELVDAMGGQVSVSSVPGQGSCFGLRLPCGDANMAIQ